MSQIILIDEFVRKLQSGILLIDARSEKEFDHAHIPGAVNIPLLNNEHRHLVGIEYKQNGREAAVALGFKLVGPYFHEFIQKANELSKNKEVMIYCWRGGMRSGIMAWILSMAGFRVTLLKGGYKSFRNFILEQFQTKKKILILGGHTGSGKTEVLKELKKSGQQVIDLEALASHRGSAFGQLGLPPQPSIEYFENQLGLLWNKADESKVLWLEGESRTIGKVKIPDIIYEQLQSAALVELLFSRDYRKKRILEEYGKFSKDELVECTVKLKKKLGNLRLSNALFSLNEGDLDEWLELLLDYYDKNYAYSMDLRPSKKKISVELSDTQSPSDVAEKLISLIASKEKELV